MQCNSEFQLLFEGEKKNIMKIGGVFDGKFQVIEPPFESYGFAEKRAAKYILRDVYGITAVRESELLQSDSKKTVLFFSAVLPKTIAYAREILSSKGITTFECDVPIKRRFFVDQAYQMHYYPEHLIWIDTEIDDSKGFPAQYGKYRFESYAYYCDENDRYEWVSCRGDERKALVELLAVLRGDNGKPKTVMVGFNVKFDFNHIVERMKELKIEGWEFMRDYVYPLDLRTLYKRDQKGLSEYSLEEIADREGFVEKHREKRVVDLTEGELREYNTHDVELMLDIEKKYGYIRTQISLHENVNLPMSERSMYKIGDTLILRRVRELGFVAPNGAGKENEGYRGAFVREPKYGVSSNIATVDVSGLYPNALLEENIDIDGFGGRVSPFLVRKFLTEKDEAGKRSDKVGKEIAKLKANAIGYGLLGYGNFRFFDAGKAKRIVDRGKMILFQVENILERAGMRVIYQDTDSAFFECGESNPEVIVELINGKIKPYSVVLENMFRWIIFLKKISGEKRGAKKKYVGMDKKGEMKIRGVILRRGDWNNYAKSLYREAVVELGEGRHDVEWLDTFISKAKLELYEGKHDRELTITRNIRSEGEYKLKPDGVSRYYPPYWSAYLKAQEVGDIPKNYGEFTYVIVKHRDRKDRYAAFIEGRRYDYDYKYIFNHMISSPLKQLKDSFPDTRQRQLEAWV